MTTDRERHRSLYTQIKSLKSPIQFIYLIYDVHVLDDFSLSL